jgi:hypothetical protein
MCSLRRHFVSPSGIVGCSLVFLVYKLLDLQESILCNSNAGLAEQVEKILVEKVPFCEFCSYHLGVSCEVCKLFTNSQMAGQKLIVEKL